MKKLCIFIGLVLLISCSDESTNSADTENSCNTSTLESSLTTALDNQASSVDFTFSIERADGRTFTYNRGSSTLNTVYESASTSKWVSAAVILWAVDQFSTFSLLSSTSTNYPSWSMPLSDPLYNLNIDQLLSFTSGLTQDPFCLTLGIPLKSYSDCINDNTGSVVSQNQGNSTLPGSSFYYSASHLQVAGAMAAAAGSFTDWQALFSSFKLSTGLFSNSDYSLPRTANPRLAGGMTWTANDYLDFLKALHTNTFLSTNSFNEMLSDQTASIPFTFSPAFADLGEQWHYGYGNWLECQSSVFNCSSIDYHSSPGAFGSYPFINFNKNFFGIIARQGSVGTFTEGVDLFRSVRSLAEDWADCSL